MILSDGVVRAYDALVKACNTAQLQEPELVTSTNLRKYMATVTQVLDLKPNEMEWVLNHLGHTMDVHKVHYRATSDILERTQIAKLLLMQDHNKVAAFKNKPLQDIQIEDIVFGAENGEMDNEVFEKDLLDIDKESDVEEPKQSKRTRGASNSKCKWTEKEEEEIRKLFQSQLQTCTRPSPKDCERALKASHKAGGIIWKRKKDVLKKKLFRIIDKIKKQAQH